MAKKPIPQPTLHLIKLCVGVERLSDQVAWQAARSAERRAVGEDWRPRHVTRMWPRRAEELLKGGSLYWVIKGMVLARQRIAALEPTDLGDGIMRCGIIFDPRLQRVIPQPRRPFQGWRYLAPEDAPADIGEGSGAEEELPDDVRIRLAEIGVF